MHMMKEKVPIKFQNTYHGTETVHLGTAMVSTTVLVRGELRTPMKVLWAVFDDTDERSIRKQLCGCGPNCLCYMYTNNAAVSLPGDNYDRGSWHTVRKGGFWIRLHMRENKTCN